MTCKYYIGGVRSCPASSKSVPSVVGRMATIRQPSDPYFYATIILQNVVVGSQYWLADASDLSNVLATGNAGASEVQLDGIPAYANPMLVEIRLRKGTIDPKYQPFKTYGYLVRDGVTIYCAQVEDSIAN